jgi:hypothetical protein
VAAFQSYVVIPHAKLGAYHSAGDRDNPAWDINTDPVMVKNYGNGHSGVIVLRCNCGRVIRLLDHAVSADGKVSPSIWHDVPECGWHVWGQFKDWDKGEWRQQAPQAIP